MFKDIGLPEWLLEMDETPVEKMAEALFAIDADHAAAQAKVVRAQQSLAAKKAADARDANKPEGKNKGRKQ